MIELAEGGSLRRVLDDRARYPEVAWNIRISWLVGIATGMAELHNMLPRGIIHRDLKSANVLLSSVDIAAGVPKVCDFGISMALEAVRASQTGGSAGTLAFKAPETFSGQYSNASDVFAFGVVCFEIISRRMPFDTLLQPEITAKLMARFEIQEALIGFGVTAEQQRTVWDQSNPLAARRPDLAQCDAGCPAELQDIAARCWTDSPTDRPTFAQCVTLLQSVRLARNFGSSNFKRAYEHAHPVTLATEVFAAASSFMRAYCTVHNLTGDGHQALMQEFILGLQRQTGGHAAVDVLDRAGPTAELLWTSDRKFVGVAPEHAKELCSLINSALRADHPDLAGPTASMVRAINTLCVVRGAAVASLRFPAGGITFRGGGFCNSHREFFTVGKRYRVPGFLASSFSEAVATDFRDRADLPPDGSRILWRIHVDPAGEHDPSRRCKHVNFIDRTHVLGEQEFLFAPYSIFTVTAVAWGGAGGLHCVDLDAATDNVGHDAAAAGAEGGRWATPANGDDLPLAPWY